MTASVSFINLPQDVLIPIVCKVDIRSLCRLSMTCKRFQVLINQSDKSNSIWKAVFIKQNSAHPQISSKHMYSMTIWDIEYGIAPAEYNYKDFSKSYMLRLPVKENEIQKISCCKKYSCAMKCTCVFCVIFLGLGAIAGFTVVLT